MVMVSTNMTDATEEACAVADASTDRINVFICIGLLYLQLGFIALNAASSVRMNKVYIHFLMAVDHCVGAILWWAFGFAFYSGTSWAGIIGISGFFSEPANAMDWVVNYVFLSRIFTIVSTTTATRLRRTLHLSLLLHTVIVVTCAGHAVWHEDGFLNKLGFTDITGAGVVHLLGGTVGLVWTQKLGPRIHRKGFRLSPLSKLTREEVNAVRSLSTCDRQAPVASLICLSVTWVLLSLKHALKNDIGYILPFIASNTILASSSAGLTGIIFSQVIFGHISGAAAATASISGTLATTEIAAYASSYEVIISSSLVSLIASFLQVILFNRSKIDDPIGLLPIHFMGGLFAVILPGILANHPECGADDTPLGLFRGGGGSFLGIQLLGAVYLIGLGVGSSILLSILLSLRGSDLRMESTEEAIGEDICFHGRTMYASLDTKRITLEILQKSIFQDALRLTKDVQKSPVFTSFAHTFHQAHSRPASLSRHSKP